MLQSLKRKLRSWAWLAKPYAYTARNWWAKIGTTETTVTRFVVITRSRTGSTLIDHSLRNHPNVISDGEILNWRHGRDVNWLIDNIYAPKGPKVKAIGFKVFYYHPQDDDSGTVWRKLLDVPDLHVIHLKRNNRLDTYLSRAIAGQSLVWSTSKQTGPHTPVTLKVDPREAEADFIRTENFEQEFDRRFAQHPLLQVSYESLLHDYAGTMQRIQQFIKVPVVPVETKLRKQSKRTAAEKISNYDELKAYFDKTPWATFFPKRSAIL